MRPATDSLPPILGSWARALIDVFYPRNCILTGEPLADSRYRYLSDVAVRRLPRIHDPRCPTCGHPYYGDIETAPACHHCENLQPAFKTGRCGYLFKRDIRIILHSLKYRKRTYLARDIALLLADAPGFLDFLSGAVLVPVPLHPTKLRKQSRITTSGEPFREVEAGPRGIRNFRNRRPTAPRYTLYRLRRRLYHWCHPKHLLSRSTHRRLQEYRCRGVCSRLTTFRKIPKNDPFSVYINFRPSGLTKNCPQKDRLKNSSLRKAALVYRMQLILSLIHGTF